MTSKLRVSGIEVSYGETTIVNGVSFDVPQGDFVGIVGPNGSGKTTLLRSLSRTLSPSRGSVYLDEKQILHFSARDLAQKMAVVPQETNVAFEFTCLEVVLMGRSPHLGRFSIEGSQDLDIAREAMEQTKTLHLADRSIDSLSGGERQRVIIARALAQQPEIILLDEPTSHLDINFQVEILELVRGLIREKGITVVAVLHDLNLSAQYCDWMILLKDGRIHAAGTPEDALTADNVRQVYGAEVWVRRHPATGRPYVITGVSAPMPGSRGAVGLEKGLRVHVVSGGGSGAPVFARLLKRGHSVTAGVLNVGDTDQDVAESLGIRTVTEAPFTVISEEAERANRDLIAEADCVVIADAPFGPSNIPNLEASLEAAQAGKTVFILGGVDPGSRDFTDGRASGILRGVASAGGISIANLSELSAAIDNAAARR